MFSSSVAGGSVCFRCQLRAVTRRAIPSVAAAQIRGQRRQYASEATKPDSHEDDLETILRNQRHDETRQRQRSNASWGLEDEHDQHSSQKQAALERRTCPHCRKLFNSKQDMQRHKDGGSCSDKPSTDDPAAWEEAPEASGARPEGFAAHDGLASSVDRMDGPAFAASIKRTSVEGHQLVRRTYEDGVATKPKKKEHKNRYRRGSMTLEADAAKLDVDTLGKPAEVIVLRDRGTWKKKALPVLKVTDEETQSSLAREDLLQDEEIPTLDFLQYINGLKPEQKTVPAREFKALYDKLLVGFTSLQLEYYVEWHRKGQPPFEEKVDETLDEELVIDEDALVEDVAEIEEATASEDVAEAEEVTADEDVAADEDQIAPSSLFDKPVEYPWMLEQSHWTPEVAGAVDATEHPLRGYILKSMRPKNRLAVQLMRECWAVSAQELQNGNGRLDIRVRDLEFKLLTLGNQRWLRRLSNVFLKQGKQMEVIRSQNLIRIVAPKAIAETCANALNETFERMKMKSFSLDQVPMQHLDASILAELGKITNSVVEFGDSNDIRVSWINIRDDSQAKLEDLGDVIFRLLLTSHTSASTSNKITVYPEIEDNGRMIEDFSDKTKMPWVDRRREWARLCLPLTPGRLLTAKAWPLTTEALRYKVQPSAEDFELPTSTPKPKVDAYYQNFDFPRPLEGEPLAIPKPPKELPEEQKPKDPQGLQFSKPTISGWMPYKVSTNAVFGHILHEHNPSLIQALSQPTSGLVNWPRALSPLIPPIASMHLPAWVPYKKPIEATSTILMRFVPYTGDLTTTYTSQAPQLELRIHASDSEVLMADSLRAISQTSVSDILLPSEHVDVRSTQRLFAEVPGFDLRSTDGMGPLLAFLEDSRLQPDKGELVTPPRLRDLGLPSWLVRGGNLAARQHKQDAKGGLAPPDTPDTPEDNALVPTSYVFAGLEVHRTIETTYDGWKLVYASIEAGQGGGRRAELSLEAVPGYDQNLRRARSDINSTFFLRSMYQLARGLKGHAVQGLDGEQVRTSISWVDLDWSGGA